MISIKKQREAALVRKHKALIVDCKQCLGYFLDAYKRGDISADLHLSANAKEFAVVRDAVLRGLRYNSIPVKTESFKRDNYRVLRVEFTEGV